MEAERGLNVKYYWNKLGKWEYLKFLDQDVVMGWLNIQ